MKVVVVGANGQLGADAVEAFRKNGDTVVALTHAEVEISAINSVWAALKDLGAELIINTAAMHQVEQCEAEPANAFAINALGPRNLAMVARDTGAVLMQVSTDYVFDGSKNTPYKESDVPRPLNTYGITKLAGEHFVRSIVDRHFVLRTSALYGKHPCRGKGGLNFVDLMLKLGKDRGIVRVVNSEETSPTSTCELAHQMVALSRSHAFGLFHASAEGSCTWYDFAREIFSLGDAPVRIEIAGPHEFLAKVPRPSYSVLNNAGLNAQGLNCFRPWREGLRRYLGVDCVRS